MAESYNTTQNYKIINSTGSLIFRQRFRRHVPVRAAGPSTSTGHWHETGKNPSFTPAKPGDDVPNLVIEESAAISILIDGSQVLRAVKDSNSHVIRPSDPSTSSASTANLWQSKHIPGGYRSLIKF